VRWPTKKRKKINKNTPQNTLEWFSGGGEGKQIKMMSGNICGKELDEKSLPQKSLGHIFAFVIPQKV